MFRTRTLIRPGLTLAVIASCSSPSTPQAPDPQPTPDPGAVTQPEGDQLAVALGVAVDSRDERGAPRLVRAIAPRPTRLAGMTPDQAARDHLAALSLLWLRDQHRWRRRRSASSDCAMARRSYSCSSTSLASMSTRAKCA